MQDFQSWNDINFSFADKDLQPFDNIHLPIHNFISQEILQSAVDYLSIHSQPNSPSIQQIDSPSVT